VDVGEQQRDWDVRDWDVVVFGGANTDFLVQGERLPVPGETVECASFHEGAGGKALNQAVAAARLGGRVALLARIGRDARGDILLATMERELVAGRFVVRDPDLQTGVALIMVGAGGEKQIAWAPGANHALRISDVEAARDALARTRMLLAPLEAPLDVIQAAMRLAHATGARTIVDAGPAVPLPDDMLRLVHVLRANAGEAEALTGIPVRDRASARRAAQALLAKGITAAAIQAGDEGNLLVWQEDEVFLQRIPLDSVDATGAGDAFAAALAITLGEGWTYAEAGRFANAAAALATTVVGAQPGLPTRMEVEALLRGLRA
jgi:ribokinase